LFKRYKKASNHSAASWGSRPFKLPEGGGCPCKT